MVAISNGKALATIVLKGSLGLQCTGTVLISLLPSQLSMSIQNIDSLDISPVLPAHCASEMQNTEDSSKLGL